MTTPPNIVNIAKNSGGIRREWEGGRLRSPISADKLETRAAGYLRSFKSSDNWLIVGVVPRTDQEQDMETLLRED